VDVIGRQLGPGGRYRVQAPVARGGFGAVYRAWDASLQREVALKVLIPELLREPTFGERFRREALAVAKLRHHHILEIYDFGEDLNGILYLVMPLITGGTLKDRFLESGRQPWAPDDALALAAQMLPALDFAHEHGVIHRDVKPANVLLERDWAWLADFGIARMALGDGAPVGPTLTGGAVIGTPEYMAPEQVVPDPDRPLDGRADLYAFGVVLYELLTGRVPFKGETTWETCYQVMQAPLPRPRELNPALPASVEAILLQALSRNRDDRFATGAELEAALREGVRRQADGVSDPDAHEPPTLQASGVTHATGRSASALEDASVRATAVSHTPDASPVYAGSTWSAFAPRLVRAARLDNRVYDDVKADLSMAALVQAAIVVCVSASASAASLTVMLASARSIGDPVSSAIGGIFGGLVGWLVWCALSTSIGTALFKGSGTTRQLLRTAGLAQVPGIFSVVAVVPTFGILLYLPVAAWAFVAEIGALRQTLRCSTGATVGTALIAGAISTPLQWLVSYGVSSLASQIVANLTGGGAAS
jgi:serine/threonine protein kinase